MKRLILIISIMLLAAAGKSQNYNLFEHHGNNDYSLQQCYNIIETSDDNFIVQAAAFDENQNDMHYNLYKISSAGALIDSAYINDPSIHWKHPFLKDPYNEGRYIITSIFSENSRCYYHATTINDDLEIVSEIQSEIPVGFELDFEYQKYFVDSNNDITVYARNTDTTFVLLKIDLDGNLKHISEPREYNGKSAVEYPFFEFSRNPIQYGFIRYSNNYMYIDILDNEYNVLSENTFRRFGDKLFRSWPIINASYLDENNFVFATCASYEHYVDHTHLLIKMNHNFEPVSIFEFEKSDNNAAPILNKNISTDGERLYFAYMHKNQSTNISELVVNCLDTDMNLDWTRTCVAYNHLANNAINVRKDGGVALAGFSYKSTYSYYETKDIFAVIFDEEGWSVAENSGVSPFRCYPNPCSTAVSLEISPDVKDNVNAISVYDIAGRTVKTQTAGFETVDISSLAPGIYVMKVTLADGRAFEEKIVKE